MLPDISSPGGFLLGVLSLVGVVALAYALYRSMGSLPVRSRGTDKLAHELSRIATALELLVRQRQETSKDELHPDAPLNIPTPVHRPDEAKQEEPKGEAKNSGTIPLSMFGRGR
ncbi:MAG: hypothetical protein WCC03_15810 [Candidatus Acidiferrales bacterium]